MKKLQNEIKILVSIIMISAACGCLSGHPKIHCKHFIYGYPTGSDCDHEGRMNTPRPVSLPYDEQGVITLVPDIEKYRILMEDLDQIIKDLITEAEFKELKNGLEDPTFDNVRIRIKFLNKFLKDRSGKE